MIYAHFLYHHLPIYTQSLKFPPYPAINYLEGPHVADAFLLDHILIKPSSVSVLGKLVTVVTSSTSLWFRLYGHYSCPPQTALSCLTLALSPYICLLSSCLFCQQRVSPVHLPANELYDHNSRPTLALREKGKRMFWPRPHIQGTVGVGWAGEGAEVTVEAKRQEKKNFLSTSNTQSTVVGGLCRLSSFNR